MDTVKVTQDPKGQWWVMIPLQDDGTGGVSLPISEGAADIWVSHGIR